MVESNDFSDAKSKITFTVGKDLSGQIVLADIAKADYKNVMLWVFRDNAAAIAFYEKHNFRPNGREQEALGCTEIMYTKEL